MPEVRDKIVKFNHDYKSIKIPFVIYADTRSIKIPFVIFVDTKSLLGKTTYSNSMRPYEKHLCRSK